MRPIRALRLLTALLAVTVAAPDRAGAQAGIGPVSMYLTSSVRSAGMGDAGVAVFWGDDPVDWSNPALLGSKKGFRYEWSRRKLVQDLSDQVHFTTNRAVLGAGGLAVALSGEPLDALGGYRLDYGLSVATDQNGDPLGAFRSYEDIRSVGVGLNVLQGMESLTALAGARVPRLSRFGDVSLGHNWKQVKVDLAPAAFTQDQVAARGSVQTMDRGLLVRATPYDAIGYPGWFPALERVARARLDWAYGWSEQNYDDETIQVGTETDPVYREEIEGYAIHASVTPPPRVWGPEAEDRAGWLIQAVTPLLSFGVTREASRRFVGAVEQGRFVERKGWELTVLNVFSLRHGHVDDPTIAIREDTSGWGVGFQYRDLGRIQFDHASVPLSGYLASPMKPNGVSVWVDPVRLWNRLHG